MSYNGGFGNTPYVDRSQASNVVLFTDLEGILDNYIDPQFGEGWLYTSLAEVVKNIIFLPVNVREYNRTYYKFGSAYYLGTFLGFEGKTAVGALGYQNKYNIGYYMVYDLGELYYDGYYNSYLDFEPYSKVKIYLPYYGYYEIPVKDIYKKYVQFRFVLDFKTGDGMYYIGTNVRSLSNPNKPFYYNIEENVEIDDYVLPYRVTENVDDSNTVFIANINVNIGQKISPTRTNASELERNLVLSAISGALNVTSSGISLASGYGVSSSMMTVSPSTSTTNYSGGGSTYNDSIQTINPKTNRLRTTLKKTGSSQYRPHTSTTLNSGYTTTRSYNRENYLKQKMVGDVTSSIGNILSSFNISATTEKPNSSALTTFGSNFIKIVTEVVHKTSINNDDYNRLYGRPLGEIRTLSTLQGYTEITNIHLEGEGFSTATEEEIAKIYSDLAQGFII